MKKIITFIFALTIFLQGFSIGYAQTATNNVKSSDPAEILLDMNASLKLNNTGAGSQQNYLKSLPTSKKKDMSDIWAAIIKLLLGAAAVLTVLGFFVSGVLYVTASGDEDMLKSAKKIMMYTLVGILVIAVAYGITLGLSKIQLQ